MAQIAIEFLKIIAWPITTLWLSYMFRAEIRALLARIASIKHGNTEIDFTARLAETAAKVDSSTEVQKSSTETNDISPSNDSLSRVAEISPRAAILESWIAIEDALFETSYTPERLRNVGKNTAPMLLQKATMNFPANLAIAVDNLKNLRNKAAHDSAFTPSHENAMLYITTSNKVINAIRALSAIA